MSGVALVLGTVGFFACTSFSDAGPTADGSSDAPIDTSSSDGATDAHVVTGMPPNFPLSKLIPIAIPPNGTYGIEATEVTVAQFTAFKLEYGADAGPFPRCAGKNVIGPADECMLVNAGGESQPITCVDWCDAQSYCAAIGRRLCGKIGGGPTPPGSEENNAVDQWYHACRGPAGYQWPYGDTVKEMACNTEELDAGGPTRVGSLTGCVGGVPGLFDMSGNVTEWEDACDAPDASTNQTTCSVRSGSFYNPANDTVCDFLAGLPSQTAYADVGFRCCTDVVP